MKSSFFLLVSFMCNIVFIYFIGTLNAKLDNVSNELESSEEVNMSIQEELSNVRSAFDIDGLIPMYIDDNIKEDVELMDVIY